MNIDFNILWFEDADEWYTASKDLIESYLLSLNFKPSFTRFKSIDVAQIKENEHISYDLILADLNLTNNTKGSDGIKILRNDNILADALFYSNNGISGLRDAMQSEVLEGVYTSDRREPLFSDRTKQIINKIVKRSEDIVNIRGMLMDAVSEFDVKLKETIGKHLSICGDDEISVINEYAYTKVVAHSNQSIEKSKSINGDSFYISAIESYLIDSYKLSMIANDIFKRNYPECSEMKLFHKNYSEAILDERNRLAHAKKEVEADGAFYFEDKQGNKVTYDAEKCSEIRSAIIKYDELLSRVLDCIK